ncbi:POK18 protein, partial [Oriolus oriolus]|nr:POK18 protein [Oriolus oriolus]
PLSRERLLVLNEFVNEQLEKGNIVPSNSLWNSLVFVIRKPGKDRWWLLHDLWKINEVIEDIGSLQPGLPSPSMLPQNWKIAVTDIKDCFFQIPRHPNDAPRFAFLVPSINRAEPIRRFHWRVLPQGMKNSPTICQWYVARILRMLAAGSVIVHYMDDVLVCAPNQDYLEWTLSKVVGALESYGTEIQPSKVQKTAPWEYLGMKIREQTIVPQPVKIVENPKNLREMYQLCGTINWLRPYLGVSTGDLAPIFNLL